MPSQEAMTELLMEVDMAVLEGVDHRQCAHLTRTFDIMAEKLGSVNNSTALWAIATLLAKIMATASDHVGFHEETSKRFAAMLRTAYPVMVRALEEQRRHEEGRPPFDA